MKEFVIRRLLSMLVVQLGVITLVFLALHLAPGDPITTLIPLDVRGDMGAAQAENLRRELGLDQPLPVQYLRYLQKVIQFDLGTSFTSGRPIAPELLARFPATLLLGVSAILLALSLGVPMGILAAVKRRSWFDHLVMFASLSGVSLPGFFLGTLLILVFGLLWPVLPPSGYAAGSMWQWEGLRYLVLPAITLAAPMVATLARLTRSSMLEVLQEDFIRTARAKGLSPAVVVCRHALRNALIPVVTVLGIQLGSMMGGAVVIETVFSWPGVGRYMVNGLVGRDYPVVQATVLMLSMIFVFVVFLTDLVYGLLDPRIRYG